MKSWKFYIGLILSALFLYLAFRKVDVEELRHAFGTARYIYLIPVVFLVVFSLWCRALRWMFLLRPVKKINLPSLFSATSIGFMANNLLPARLGEFVRAYVIGDKEKISKSSSFATIVVERLFDGMTVLFFLVIILTFYSVSFPGWLRNVTYSVLVFYAAILAFLIFLKTRTGTALGIAEFITRPFPERIRSLVTRALNSFVHGLQVLKSSRDIIASAFLSLLVWLPNAFVIYFLIESFGMDLPLYASFVLLVLLSIGIMIPSAPGFVGTVQYCCVIGLAIFGVTKAQALSFSIIYHASVFIPVTAIGLVYLFLEGLSLVEIGRSAGIDR